MPYNSFINNFSSLNNTKNYKAVKYANKLLHKVINFLLNHKFVNVSKKYFDFKF